MSGLAVVSSASEVVLKRHCLVTFWCLVACTGASHAQTADSNPDRPTPPPLPISVPLGVSQTGAGTYKADLSVGIGNLAPLSFGVDTGSAGLHVFAAAHLDAPDSGVQCTQAPITFTVGNPGRIIYSGVLCYAPLHFGTVTTPVVPIGYLTSAACTSNNPNCMLPDLNDPAHGYGVLGVGIAGAMPVPNPLLSLPAPYGSAYSIALTHDAGELVLGSQEPANATRFPMTPGSRDGVKWTLGTACLFVNEQPTSTCVTISFDTGNGVAWVRAADTTGIPQTTIPQFGTVVTPTTQLGFAPQGATTAAFSLVAGSTFADRIKVMTPIGGADLTNVGIEAFFDRIVRYDNVCGTISVAPAQ